MLALIIFVGIVPIVIDVHRMPVGKAALPAHPVALKAWATWPAHLQSAHAPATEGIYEQMAQFANRSVYPMAVVERTIRDVQRGGASSNDLYEAARAAKAAAEDERDALMGLVIPPALRENQEFEEGWRFAQEAAQAKVSALAILELPSDSSAPWEQSAYLEKLGEARRFTQEALTTLSRSH